MKTIMLPSIVGASAQRDYCFRQRSSTAIAADKSRFSWIGSSKESTCLSSWRGTGDFLKKIISKRPSLKGKGSANSATFVDVGQADYSYGDFLTAVQVMSKGGRIAPLALAWPLTAGVYFLESSGIKTAKDLEGKSFGTNPSDFAYVLLPAAAGAADFDANKVVIKTMEPAVRTPALFEGKIDFMSGTNGSSIQRMAILGKRRENKVKYLFFKDMGLETYGHVLQAREDRIKNNPDQVKRFVSAVFDAWAWSLKNPKEAFEIFMKANPQKDRDISLAQMEAGLDDVVDQKPKSGAWLYERGDDEKVGRYRKQVL